MAMFFILTGFFAFFDLKITNVDEVDKISVTWRLLLKGGMN
ncbi:hypothetical protein [Colwellia sp. D2M02]|nr:hypothetical protein [Colwellia sp. D2M02]